MFLKKKTKEDEEPEKKIILGMVLLKNAGSFSFDAFLQNYRSKYTDTVDQVEGDDIAATFAVNGELMTVGCIPAPVPHGDIEGTAAYAYNWPSAVEDLAAHTAHLLVAVMGNGEDQIIRFRLFTRVITALLNTTDAIGVYKGNQSLLIPGKDYLKQSELMDDKYLPLNIWIYFGLRTSDKGQSGYTWSERIQ